MKVYPMSARHETDQEPVASGIGRFSVEKESIA
jgi:hypothetical protein